MYTFYGTLILIYFIIKDEYMSVENLSEMIRKIREEKGWSREDLSKESDIPATTITKIEHGKIKSPGIVNIAKIAEALEVSVDQLINTIES